MIVGIGCDLCDTRRIHAALLRHGERFANRILGEQELVIFHARLQQSFARGVRFLASRFAVKEAFSKAIGTGIRHPMAWRNCETVSAESGQPQMKLGGDLLTWFEQRGWSAHVSISDDAQHVLAFVLVEARHPIPLKNDESCHE